MDDTAPLLLSKLAAAGVETVLFGNGYDNAGVKFARAIIAAVEEPRANLHLTSRRL